MKVTGRWPTRRLRTGKMFTSNMFFIDHRGVKVKVFLAVVVRGIALVLGSCGVAREKTM